MSDEEKRDNVYVRHPPSYRSDTLNKYIEKLDERSASSTGNHAKFERRIGTPIKKSVPTGTKKWILKTEASSSEPATEQETSHKTHDHDHDSSSSSDFDISDTDTDSTEY